jgi:hypothetical protein
VFKESINGSSNVAVRDFGKEVRVNFDITRLDADHPCQQDVIGLNKELFQICALCTPVAHAISSEAVR